MSAPAAKRPFQFSLRSLLALMAAVGVVYGCGVCVQSFSWDHHGPVADRSKWSPPLLELLADAQSADIPIEPVDVYLAHGFYVDLFYVWRMNASPELETHLIDKWKLGAATSTDVGLFWRDAPASWVTRNARSQRRYFAARHPDSDNFIVMFDDTAHLVYVWYWFDF